MKSPRMSGSNPSSMIAWLGTRSQTIGIAVARAFRSAGNPSSVSAISSRAMRSNSSQRMSALAAFARGRESLQQFRMIFEELGKVRENFNGGRAQVMFDSLDILLLRLVAQAEQGKEARK